MPRKPKNGEFNANAYINDYIKKKYDRINFTVPAGQKAVIEEHAKAAGKSVNEFIRDLIYKEIGGAIDERGTENGQQSD